MGLARLFRVPDGASGQDGAYLAYPLHDLLGAGRAGKRAGALPGRRRGSRHRAATASARRWPSADVLSYQVLRFARDGRPAPARPLSGQRGRLRGHPRLCRPLAGWWAAPTSPSAIALGLMDAAAPAAERRAGRPKSGNCSPCCGPRRCRPIRRARRCSARRCSGDPRFAGAHAVPAGAGAGRRPGRRELGRQPAWDRLGAAELAAAARDRAEALCGAQPAVIAALRARSKARALPLTRQGREAPAPRTFAPAARPVR